MIKTSFIVHLSAAPDVQKRPFFPPSQNRRRGPARGQFGAGERGQEAGLLAKLEEEQRSGGGSGPCFAAVLL